MKAKRRMRLAALLLALGAAACASAPHPGSPYDPPTKQDRNTVQAEKLSRQAAGSLDEGDLQKAEVLLRESLTADLFYGPAHNNLGVIFLMQDKLYEAAQEFEWAKKLLPAAPDPRVNLALVLERAGRSDDALLAWEGALRVAPGCTQASRGLAMARGEAPRPRESLLARLSPEP